MDGKPSKWYEQETGIKQGCPLSPYLFLIVMTVLFSDIHHEDVVKITKQRIVGTWFDEVLYTDDTIYCSHKAAAMTRVIHAIATEREHLGLLINKSKCEYLDFQSNSEIKFQDVSQITKTKRNEISRMHAQQQSRPSAGSSKKETRVQHNTMQSAFFSRHGDCRIK